MLLAASLTAAFQSGPAACVARPSPRSAAAMSLELPRRALLQHGGAAAALTALAPLAASAADLGVWRQVDLPIVTEAPILFDIEFDTKDPKNGWVVGNRGTFLQTTDGGKSWTPKSFANLDPDEEINYRFTKVSFKDGEGWIIGKPAILLHTRDSGASWERVPLSPKLPGDPYSITALGPGKAEMTTSAGAIYTTENAGRNWKAEVRETIDATLNRVSSSGVQGASYFSGSINSIQRDAAGSYLAVSARGNFYLTWSPGDEFWVPHNRETSRRITSMGFVKDRLAEGLWMTTAGGEISKTNGPVDTQLINIPFEKLQIRSGGYGLLDCVFLPDGKAWAVGGGGTIFQSTNGGQTWVKDKVADDLPSNLYKIKFFGNKGYILGSNGVLLTNA
ncbi:hypothetical protein AB1Y20_020750 [Prymnesium parvum]|uniref:Photosynthesis system II assembly factor Ycf48/Hcf136-like domain-containing protein n=1 Tax=Prymnesium parvum TaxID=97485 RepID=A0AB34K0B2_PRYPA|mmetsp:Transcript_1357/g.3492  ORF Transcript_1357/g.3492 Transcript_1357/m.3492 type:complete len:391 (+) Transcript_1357:55-1227(+)